jgi:serine/threonine protein phosphatase PrpC
MPLTVQAYGHSDLGRKRKANEDAFAVDEARGIYIVADGMGGHGNGATASQTAVGVAREHLNANIVKFERYRDDPSEANRIAATAAVEQAIQGACERVFRIGQQDTKMRGMGTTIDVVVRAGDRAIIGHVGDGRIYLVRSGQGYRLTKDHTIVAQQVEAGVLTPEEAEQSTLRGVLTRAVGTHVSVQVDTLVLDLAAGDMLLMCSDGVHRYLRDDEVGLRLREASAGTARQIIDWANTSGGEDNSTVIVVGCKPQELAAAPAPQLQGAGRGPLDLAQPRLRARRRDREAGGARARDVHHRRRRGRRGA